MTSDLDLIRQFARENSQAAFGEIVQRHLNLVYSAALRQARSPQLSEEIAQSVFADLARNAGKLKPDTILTAWLYAVARRTAIDVIRKESRRQLREQIAVEMNNMNATAEDWTQIAPLLDDAMAALDETDRAAVLLRYFENKSLREVGEDLRISDDAAQKRVSRAVDQLREFFTKRQLTIGAAVLVAFISANAVQSAPAGLGAAILGTTLTTTSTLGMTMLHKILITGMAAATVVAGIYAVHLQSQIGSLQQQQSALQSQISGLQQQRDDATNQLAGLQDENARLRAGQDDLLRLRGEVTQLRAQKNVQQTMPQVQTNDPDSDRIQILTRAEFVLIPSEDVQFLGVAGGSTGANVTGLLTADQFKAIVEAMKESGDVRILSAPRVVSLNGQQARMEVSQPYEMDGVSTNLGLSLDSVCFFSTNSSQFNMNFDAQLRCLSGDAAQPILQTIQVTNQLTLSPGQTAVISTGIPSGSWFPDDTNIPAGTRNFYVFITPRVVDARGNAKTP